VTTLEDHHSPVLFIIKKLINFEFLNHAQERQTHLNPKSHLAKINKAFFDNFSKNAKKKEGQKCFEQIITKPLT
jgi:hypothetical protein